MDRLAIENEISAYIVNKLGIDSAKISSNAELRRDLEFTSMDMMTTISFVERKFKIKMTPVEFGKMITLGDLYSYIESHR